MKHAKPVLISAFLVIGMFTCAVAGSPGTPRSSTVTEGIYTNEYFGLTLAIPDGWFVASEDSEQLLREAGEDLVVGDNAALKAGVEAARKTTFQLLTLSEFEMGAAVDFNPSLILMAERVSHMPGIKSGKDYLFHLSKILLQAQLPYEATEDAHPVQLGGREWHRADFVVNQPGVTITQSYFVVKLEDFVLAVVLSAATAEQMMALERAAASIAF